MRQIAIVFFVSIFILASVSFAQENSRPDYRETNITIVAEDQVIDGDFFAGGELVEISGTINGDLYAAGEKVIVDGVVNGDVLAAGGIIDISGDVTQDIRVAGGHVTIGGSVGQNITAAAADLTIAQNAEINGNLVAFSDTTNIASPILGDATMITRESIIGPQGVIHGQLKKTAFPVDTREINTAGRNIFSFLKIIFFGSMLIVGLLFVHVFADFNERTVQIIRKKSLKAFFVGLSGMILMPIISVLLLATIIGIPLGLMALFLLAVLIYLAPLPAIYFIGQIILQRVDKQPHDGWIFITGLLVILTVSLIPGVFLITRVIITLFGLGALTMSFYETYGLARKKKII